MEYRNTIKKCPTRRPMKAVQVEQNKDNRTDDNTDCMVCLRDRNPNFSCRMWRKSIYKNRHYIIAEKAKKKNTGSNKYDI